MVSHTTRGGLKLSLGGGGLRFKKRPSGFNIKVGKCMKGKPGPALGRYDHNFQKEFIRCCISAGANVSAAKRSRWGL